MQTGEALVIKTETRLTRYFNRGHLAVTVIPSGTRHASFGFKALPKRRNAQ